MRRSVRVAALVLAASASTTLTACTSGGATPDDGSTVGAGSPATQERWLFTPSATAVSGGPVDRGGDVPGHAGDDGRARSRSRTLSAWTRSTRCT